MLSIGSIAPDFETILSDGTKFRLSSQRNVSNIVLYFYPKDFTSGCTVEAKMFRDRYEDIQRMGAKVLGISFDASETHQQFRESCQLPFLLISDSDKSLARQYQATWFGGLSPKRVTYVVDMHGVIRGAFHFEGRIRKHITSVIEALETLQPKA
jgi:thioredoxin-dependent peroxiredoxin